MRTMTVRALPLLVCAVLLAGCGGGGEPSAAGPDEETTSASPSPTESAEPSEPAVEPADGPRVEVGTLVLRAPKGYTMRRSQGVGGFLEVDLVTASGPGFERLTFGSFQGHRPHSLDELVKDSAEDVDWTRRPQRLDDVEVDGVMMYHLSGPSGVGYTDEEFGAEVGNLIFRIVISTEGGKAERQELADSILATARWR